MRRHSSRLHSFLTIRPQGVVPTCHQRSGDHDFVQESIHSKETPRIIKRHEILIVLVSFPSIRFAGASGRFSRLFGVRKCSISKTRKDICSCFRRASCNRLSLHSSILKPCVTSCGVSCCKNGNCKNRSGGPCTLFLRTLGGTAGRIGLTSCSASKSNLMSGIRVVFTKCKRRTKTRSGTV